MVPHRIIIFDTTLRTANSLLASISIHSRSWRSPSSWHDWASMLLKPDSLFHLPVILRAYKTSPDGFPV